MTQRILANGTGYNAAPCERGVLTMAIARCSRSQATFALFANEHDEGEAQSHQADAYEPRSLFERANVRLTYKGYTPLR